MEQSLEEEIGLLLKQVKESTQAAIQHWRQQGGDPPLPEMHAALALCKEKQRSHPMLALEAARVQVNLSAMLSQSGQHEEAVSKVQEAKRTLSTIQGWAQKCHEADPTVGIIATEASMLQSAAHLAEAIAMEPLLAAGQSSASAGVPQLPQLSPSSKSDRTPGSRQLETSRSAPSLTSPSQAKVQLPPVSPSKSSASVGDAMLQQAGQGGKRTTQAAKRGKDSRGRDGHKDGSSHRPRKTTHGSHVDLGALHVEHSSKINNIFKDFLHDVQIEKDLRMRDEHSWEEDLKKQLQTKHRLTRLYYMLDLDEDLKSKKYTSVGHEIIMKNYNADNKSRNDIPLVREARKSRKSPEVQSLRRLNKLLYVKPPTPEPQPKPNTARQELLKGLTSNLRVSTAVTAVF